MEGPDSSYSCLEIHISWKVDREAKTEAPIQTLYFRSRHCTSDPDTVLPIRRSNDLDLRGGWSQSSDLLLHPVGKTWEHGATSGQNDVRTHVPPLVQVTSHDGVVNGLVDTCELHAQERGLKQSLWAPESLVTDGDHPTVRKLVALLQAGALGSGLHLLLKVQGHVAQLLLDVTDNFMISGGDGVATLSKDLQ